MQAKEANPPGLYLPDADGDGFIQSIARGLAVVQAFRPGHERLTMAQVASACELTRAGARRILLTLQQLGFVAADGRYFYLTSRILDLTKGYLAQSLWEIARPELEQIAAELNETASAGVLDGLDVVYTVRVRAPRILQLELGPGAHLPAHASSMGRILLANASSVELAGYMRQVSFEKYTAHTVADRETLIKRLEEARSQGWCCVRDEAVEGVTGVSVPVKDHDARTIAALNVSLSTARATDAFVHSEVVPTLQRAAARIAAAL